MSYYFIPKYCDASSIFLVNQQGAIRKLFCPFQVRPISNEGVPSNKVLWVEQVSSNAKQELIFWIFNKPYHHTHFYIIAIF